VVTDPRTTTLFSAAEAARLNADRYVSDQVAILGSGSVAQRSSDSMVSAEPSLLIDADEIAGTVEIFTTGTNEILVRYTSGDEETAVAAVNAVIDAYSEVRREAAVNESASAIEQLDRSIADIDEELTDIEQQVLAIKSDPTRVDLENQYRATLERVLRLQPLLSLASDERLLELRAELGDADNQLDRLASVIAIENGNTRLTQLDREQSRAIERRSALASERDRLLVDTELLSGGISLSSPAEFALEMTADVETITVLGALVGLLVGTGIAYLRATKRRKFNDSGQPSWILHSALLAEIPIFGEEGITSEVPVLDYPASVSAETFRFAATALDLQLARAGDKRGRNNDSVQTFLVASAGPGDGKTLLTANLASAAARKGRTVLAIDADFGNQRLTEILRPDGPDGPGITEVVETNLDLAEATIPLGPSGTLDLLSRGLRQATAPDFFSLPATKAFIENVGTHYDIVLIDGPPMLHVAYASALARYVDRVVVVVRHDSAVKQVEDLAQRLDLIGTPLAGYVYNAAPLQYSRTLTGGSLHDVLGDVVPTDVEDAKIDS
jgi:tyrosine-protein kinase Etk/Wzc